VTAISNRGDLSGADAIEYDRFKSGAFWLATGSIALTH
jgi:hypothetical protein